MEFVARKDSHQQDNKGTVELGALTLIIISLMFAPLSYGFALLDARWSNGQVNIALNFSGNSPAGISWDAAMRTVVDDWQNPVSGLSINAQSRSDVHPCDGFANGGSASVKTNAVAFGDNICSGDFGANTLAVTLLISSNGVFQESDIVFNNAISWDVFSGSRSGFIDFNRVASHEIGHLIGLDHERVQQAIMRPVIGSIEGPTADDLAGARAIYTQAQNTPDIILNLEEPAAKQVQSGVSNLRGWAVARQGVDRIELFIDQTFTSVLPFGSLRSDVAAAYPAYADSSLSGFSVAFNWNNLSAGAHDITVVVYDKAGNRQVSRSEYTVASFDTSFISDPGQVSINGGVEVQSDGSLLLRQVSAAGVVYDIRLQWQSATQQWEVVDIIK